ncbi:hypothetical protein [Devosia sp. 2618]|uniref:hypothetical protein n=1 Tax=Devosia sp. 2618 TaxID=3156454 RepID=UPI0033931511
MSMPSIAVTTRDTNWMGGVAHKLRARAAGGAHAYLRDRLVAKGEPLLASKTRMGREAWARTQCRYRLRNSDGLYVNIDLSGTTENVADSWIGFAGQLDAVRAQRPDLAGFRTVELLPQAKRPVAP